ncbi:MAG: glycosyltransferase family 39 protein [Planctomycetes bacterium]|nr:glycosyltransferase family 39 protein [Planctomycetota bacterium]
MPTYSQPGLIAGEVGAAPSSACRPMKPATWGWLVALLGWTALLSFYQLDGGAGLEPVEAWVAQPAREMYQNIARMIAEKDETGWQWRPLVIPEFCGETRMQKSPGACWAVCLTSYLRGTAVDEVSARIPNAIAALLLVVTIFWLTRRIAGDRAAIFAGFAAASSTMVLHWSHGAASDLGVATLITMSLACLWVASEDEPPGWKRNTLWLLGYFFAGLGMLYKLPLPMACVGLPAFLYVLLRNRWKSLASWWHLLGLLLFLLPWLPWALAAMHFEDTALFKWRVEYFDRVTGDLPNVENQVQWYFYLLYVGVALLLTIPYSLSLPLALFRPFRRHEGVNRNGVWFMLIWFVSLLVFLTVATGKETRYVLPAMPPLFVLLGGELSAFFDPDRRASPERDKLGLIAVCLLVPGTMCALAFLLHQFWRENASQDMFTWAEVWQPYAVAAVILSIGAILAALLYYHRRENASFAALVGTMWVMWLWVWPQVMPILVSQMPFKDFAEQLKTLAPEHQAAIRQIAQQDPRYVWYSDVRFPRVINQLELLEEQGGRRNLDYEIRRLAEQAVRLLEGDELALFVASPKHYVIFLTDLRAEWESEGRTIPATHLWMQSRVGREDRRYLLFGNRPPPWESPELQLTPKLRAKLEEGSLERGQPTSGPTARPASASDE